MASILDITEKLKNFVHILYAECIKQDANVEVICSVCEHMKRDIEMIEDSVKKMANQQVCLFQVINMAFKGNRETLKMKQAFECYYALSDDRSYEAVAEKFDVSKSTVSNWANAFNWKQRIIDRDEKLANLLSKDVEEEALMTRKQMRKIVKESIEKFTKELVSEGVKITDIGDFEKLVKLDLLLCGELDGGENAESKYKIDDAKQQVESRINSIIERQRSGGVPGDTH